MLFLFFHNQNLSSCTSYSISMKLPFKTTQQVSWLSNPFFKRNFLNWKALKERVSVLISIFLHERFFMLNGILSRTPISIKRRTFPSHTKEIDRKKTLLILTIYTDILTCRLMFDDCILWSHSDSGIKKPR